MTSAFLSTSNILVCIVPSCILERGFEWGDPKGLSPPGLQVCHATSWEKSCVGYHSHFCQAWGAYTRCFHVCLHLCYPWSQLRVSLSYVILQGRTWELSCEAPFVIWTSFVLLASPHFVRCFTHVSDLNDALGHALRRYAGSLVLCPWYGPWLEVTCVILNYFANSIAFAVQVCPT